jgi:hypothetical protein
MRPLKYKIARLWLLTYKANFPFQRNHYYCQRVWCDTQSFSQSVWKRQDATDVVQLTKEDGTSFYVCFQYRDNNKTYLKLLIKSVWLQESVWRDTLVNGLPLVQIELKRSDIEIKAFNQINSCQNHSFWSNHGLFQYVQLFVIINGVNTKYWPTITAIGKTNLLLGMLIIIKITLS